MELEYTIAELSAQMADGRQTSASLVQAYLDRIAVIDRDGPRLNSVIELNPEALEIAAGLDRERREGKVRGPLHGIPVLIKDNFDTADQMTTTAGSLALEGNIAAQDSTVAARLREAGAVLLGKTNLSEWANFRSSRSMSGWSSRGGQTRNPYVLDRSPCGSSSGSGAAAAANLCAAAVGTETDGSVICPSQTNGLVGLKPTLGLISRAGVIPIAHSQDTPGPMTRTVEDAAILLGALAGEDRRDPATAASEGHAQADYTLFLDGDGLKGARLGVARNFFGFHPDVDASMAACLEILKARGAVLVDPVRLKMPKRFGDAEMNVLYYEFKADLNAYLSALGPEARVHSMAEVIEFNEKHRERLMPYFGQERMLKAQKSGPLTDEKYLKALETGHKLAGERGIDAVLKRHRLDAIIAPSGGPAWLVDRVWGDYSEGGCTSPAAVAGYPHITVPAGLVNGLPVGLSFIASTWAEPTLLRLAYAFEQASHLRQPPQYLPHL